MQKTNVFGYSPDMTISHRDYVLKAIAEGLKKKKLSEHAACKAAGIYVDAIRDMKRGNTQMMRADRLQKIFRVLEIDYDGSVLDNTVELVGEVGAGGEVRSADVKGQEVEAPAEAVEHGAVAVRIKGNSMYPAYKDGEYLYFKRNCDFSADYYGKDCVVELADGRTLVKILQKGTEKSTFTLGSYNEPPIENVRIKWACPVRWVRKF